MLMLLVLFSPLAIDIYLPALPLIAEAFHVKHNLVQDTISWFLFALGLGQLFAGPLADKYGRRAIALSGICLYGVAAYLASIAQGIDWLLACRLLQGLGACATSVAAFAIVRDSYGAERSGHMISYLNGVICFVPALAPILGSYLTQQFGWQSNFTLMAVYALCVGGVLVPAMQETNPTGCDESAVISGRVFSLRRYLSVLNNPTFLFHAMLCLVSMAVILAYVSAAPLVLMQQLGLSMNEFTHWFGLNALFNILAAFSAPKLMQRIGTFNALLMGLGILLISGVLMLLLAEQQTAMGFMLPIFFSSVGFSVVLGAAAGKALAPFGEKAGTAAALLGLFQMSGAGLLVAGSQRIGLEPRLHLALLMLLILPGLILLLSRKGRQWHLLESESYSAI